MMNPTVPSARNPRWRLMLGAIPLLAFAAAAVDAADAPLTSEAGAATGPAARTEETPLQFRRVYVPAGRIDDVTRGSEQYLPVLRESFERLVDASHRDRGPAAVRVERATYRAELQGPSLLNAVAKLDIACASAEPAWLDLPLHGLVAEAWRWSDGRPCLAGTYHDQARGAARHGVIVASSGTLIFPWTARGRALPDGAEFRLSFPPASVTELILTTPAGIRLSAEGASIRNVARTDAGGLEHRLALRAGAPIVLTAQFSQEQTGESEYAVRQTTTYTVAPGGTEVDARLRIAPFALSPSQISLQHSSGVEIVDMRLAGQPLEFSQLSAGENDQHRVSVQLGQSVPVGESELRVRAVAPTLVGSVMELPSIHLERSAWLAGVAEVRVHEDLEVRDLTYDGFRPEPGEVVDNSLWVFSQSEPQASLAIRVERAPKGIRGRVLTTATAGLKETSATIIVDLESEYAAESIFQAEVAANWRITSLESEPAGYVRSWLAERSNRASTLQVVLNRPLAPSNPVRLKLTARRGHEDSPGVPLRFGARQLVPLRFNPLITVDQWVEFTPDPSLAASRGGKNPVPAITRNDVPASLRDLVNDARDGYLFKVDKRVEQTDFSIYPRAAEIAGDVEIHAHVTDSVVQYTCRFLVDPQSAEVTQLGMVLSTTPERLGEWQFTDAAGRSIAAERATPDAATTDTASRESAFQTIRWRLARPQLEPFELNVSFEVKRDAASPLVLAALETRQSSSGVVYITGEPSLELALENRKLEPLPTANEPSPGSTGPIEFYRAYRFQPERIILSDEGPSLVIRQVDPRRLAPAMWIDDATLDSAYLPNGQALHHLSLAVENRGPEQLEVELPQARSVLYRLGNGSWRQVTSASDGTPLAIPFASTANRTQVDVRFSTPRRPLGTIETLRPATLRFSVPVGRITYRAWLGRGYGAFRLDHPAQRLLVGLYALTGRLHEERGGPIDAEPGFARGLVGWDLRDSGAASGAAALLVVRTSTIRLWCVALLAAGATVGVWLFRARGIWLAVVPLVGWTVALVAPAAFVPPVSAVAWGCVAGVLVVSGRIASTHLWRRLAPVERKPLKQALASSVVLLVGLTFAYDGFAAEPIANSKPNFAIPRVMDPIAESDEGSSAGIPGIEPYGQYVYVPEALYGSLLRRERNLRAPVGEWLLTGCQVRGRVTGAVDRPAIDPGGWSMLIQLESFRPHAEIELPLSREGAQWQTEAFRLDGAQAVSWWSNDGRILYVRAPAVGRHNLELPVSPRISRDPETTKLTLPMPAVASSQLDLSVPADFPAADFPGLVGDVRYLPSMPVYRGTLGSIGELIVTWPGQPSEAQEPVPTDLLTWVRVGPESTLVELRLVVHVDSDQPCYLEVAAPPGVRFLPTASELPYARLFVNGPAKNGGLADTGQRIALTVTGNGPDSLTIPLQFVIEHPPAPTTIQVPRLAIEGRVAITSRSLALESAPGVQAEILAPSSAESTDVDGFLSRWGQVDSQPDAVYREPPVAAPWRLRLQSEDVRVAATEIVTAIANPGGIDVDYRSQCRVEQGAVLVHAVRKSKSFSVAAVEVAIADRNLAVNWSEAESGDLRIILPEALTDAHTLRIRGSVPSDEQGNVELVMPTLQGAQRLAARLTTGRVAETTVEIEQSDLLTPDSGASVPAGWQDEWYLHGQYMVANPTSDAGAIRMKIGAVREPQDARSILTVVPDQGGWAVSLHCAILGLPQPLDRIVILAPNEWQEPYLVDPESHWRVSTLHESGQVRIILRPRQPTSSDVLVTVRGQLPRSRQDSVTIPLLLRVAEPVVDDSLIALGRVSSEQALQWFPQSMQLLPADAAALFEPLIGPPSDWLVYRRSEASQPASARLNVVEQTASAPHISLMEAFTLFERHEPSYITTTYTVDPRGLLSCDLLLPDSHRLLDVRVNGRSQPARETASGRWQVQLASSKWPQLLQVTSQSAQAVGADDEVRQVRAPVLMVDETPIPVEQTAWHIQSDRRLRRAGGEQGGGTQISEPMLAATRFANLVEALDDAVPALLRNPDQSWLGWLEDWRGRIRAAQAEYDRRAVASNMQDSEATARAEQAEQQLAALEDLLAATADASTIGKGGFGESSDADPSSVELEGANNLWVLGDGRIDGVRLHAMDGPRRYTNERILGAILLSVLGLGAIVVGHGDVASRFKTTPTILYGVLCAFAVFVIASGHIWAILGGLVAAVFVVGWRIRRVLS